jgi:hypothetical protein
MSGADRSQASTFRLTNLTSAVGSENCQDGGEVVDVEHDTRLRVALRLLYERQRPKLRADPRPVRESE